MCLRAAIRARRLGDSTESERGDLSGRNGINPILRFLHKPTEREWCSVLGTRERGTEFDECQLLFLLRLQPGSVPF